MTAIKGIRPTAPVVINLIALSIVLGGQALALPGKHTVTKADIARGAVTAANLRSGIVGAKDLRRGAVREQTLAKHAVTGRAIKPGAVVGLSLTGVQPSVAQIPDADPIGDAGDFTWTSSGATLTCPFNGKLFSGGVAILGPNNGRGFVQSTSPSTTASSTWVGQISTDTGGTSPAQLLALCLKK